MNIPNLYSDPADISMRMIIDSSWLRYSGDWVKVLIDAHPSDSCTITGMSIGVQSSGISTVDTPRRLLFNGQASGTSAAGTIVETDWLYFPFDKSLTHLIHLTFITDTCALRYVGLGGDRKYVKFSSEDDTLVTSPSGYSSDGYFNAICGILVASNSDIRYLSGKHRRYSFGPVSVGI